MDGAIGEEIYSFVQTQVEARKVEKIVCVCIAKWLEKAVDQHAGVDKLVSTLSTDTEVRRKKRSTKLQRKVVSGVDQSKATSLRKEVQ